MIKFILLFFISLNLYSHNYDYDFTPKEKEWLKNHKKIRVRVANNNPPVHFVENGFKGISVEYIEIIAKKLNLKIEFLTDIPWSKALEYIKNREKIDVLLTIKRTKEREKFIAFTKDYLEIPWVIFTKKDNEVITKIKDLNSKVVSVENAYVIHKKLEDEYPDINLKVMENSKDAIEELSINNRVDAYIGDLMIATYLIGKYNFTNIKVAGETPFDNHNQAMGVRKDWSEFASIFDKVYNSLTQEEHNEIRKKWLSINYETKIDYQLILKIVIVFLTISAIIIYWNRKLKELNDDLEKRVEEEVQKRLKAEEREKIQKEILIQQSKMAEMGEMIGVIAHQLKQPLNAISIFTQDLIESYEYGELNEKYIEKFENTVINQIDYMSNTINDFRNFFKPSKEKIEFNIKESIEGINKLISPQFIKHNIKVKIFAEDNIYILGYSNEFQQAILNILNNSKDNFEEKKIENAEIIIYLKKIDNNIIIEIKDNGGGIKDELLPEKIFQRYISTKGEKGTGIGLSISKVIIEEKMNGKLWAKNHENGAIFIIEFENKI